jgi:glycosyltransferase involved in cell wall biosynthesis
MHILLIHQAFATLDEPGGTRHHELSRFLADAGHQVSIIASPVSYLTGKVQKNQRLETDGDRPITIHRVYTYPALHKNFFHRALSFFSFMISSFFRALTIKKVDIVWGTTPPIFQSFTAWLISALKRVPVLLEIRDLWPAFAVEVGVLKNPLLIRMSLCLERFLYRKAGHVVVNSPGYFQHVREKGAKNITLIPNGADISLFPDVDTSKLRKDLGWTDDFIVLYAGAHGMSNDLETLLDTAQILEPQAGLRFILLGDGKEKSLLMERARVMNLKNLSFYDPVPKSEMGRILSSADACVAILKPIDLYKTTYPNKVFDYMAAGKPVVLAIDGVIRGVVEEARCGLFCQPGNPQEMAEKILYLFHNPVKSREMGKNGRDYLSRNFDRQMIARQLADLISEMAGKDV